jgi:Ca2+-binding RTX toxin-like protein
MNTQRNFGKRQLAIAAGATLAAGLVAAAPAQAETARGSASVADATLTIVGTVGDDEIAVGVDAGDPSKVLVDLGNGTLAQEFDRNSFDTISVFLRRGDDQFHVVPGGTLADETLSVVGGPGDDTIVGGDGNDSLFGRAGSDNIQGAGGTDLIIANSGRDSVNGNAGNDTEFLGRGDDEALWNPGEGSDIVEGAGGSDTLTFNGSDSNEIMSLSADGSRAVFLRDLGLIRMDMDDVERFDLATLGGVDTVDVNSLAGTDVGLVNIDLSAAVAGAGDADTVTVSGTNRADDISVDADDSSVNVTGLPAATRVTGSETTDQLVVNSLGGNDEVDVSNAAEALIGVVANLGTGQL